MIFADFSKALGQIGDPRFQSVFWRGIGLTLVLLAALFGAVFWLVGWLVPDSFTLPLIGTITWVDSFLSFGALGLMLVLSVFLMVPVASAFTGLFLDEVAEAVEDRHYTHLPQAGKTPLSIAISDSLRFLGVIFAANLIALFLYLITLPFLIFAPFAPFIFVGLNGYLLGREYFQMVAIRRLTPEDARRVRKRHGATIWFAGLLMALPLSIPVINLLVPVLGAATFTHLFQRLASDPSG